MEDGSRDLKKKLLIHEDESGLELSLGLSLGGGGAGSSLERKSSTMAAAAVATVTVDGDSSAHEEEWNVRNNHSSQELWLRKAMIQQQQQQHQQQQQQSQQQSRLREFLATSATPAASDISAQQQQMAAVAAAWRQMNHVDPGAKFMTPSNGIPLSMGDLAKFLAAGKGTPSSSALVGHQSQQQHQQQQQQQQPQPREDDDELESVEQQKKFFQHQEARKKRKMLIDEQKQNKKAKDDDKPDGAENAAGGLSHVQRATSLGAFQNQAGPSAMAALATQLMRRTISDPSLVAQLSSRDDGNPATAAATASSSQEAEAGRALDPNATVDETKQLLGMWQLGTTVDVPSAESINPELSSLRPGTVAGQIGGTGSSPDLPWVSASGPGGKAISGVAYKLFQGQYKIVCSCHGLHMSPSDFVKHAESLDGSSANGVKGLGDSMPVLSQVTPA